MASKLSAPVVATCLGLFGLGVVAGLVQYMNRSSVLEKYVPGSSAVGAHLVLAGLAALALGVLFAIGRQRLLTAPFSKSAFERFQQTVRLQSRLSVSTVARMLVSLFLALLFLYNFWRAGDQVLGGLDPNYVVNAWGGPSYWGASLAHWLDTVLLLYAQAALLHVAMVRRK